MGVLTDLRDNNPVPHALVQLVDKEPRVTSGLGADVGVADRERLVLLHERVQTENEWDCRMSWIPGCSGGTCRRPHI